MLSIINQNKFVPHLIKQLKKYPHTNVLLIQQYAHLTFGSEYMVTEVDNNTLTINLSGIMCLIEKKENRWEVNVDDEIVDVVYFN